MKIKFQKLKKLLPGLKKNISLKNQTTFKIGGPAKYFYEANKKEDLIKAVLVARKFHLPFFVLGGGSNILASDEGFNGLVIKIKNKKLKIKDNEISAEAGVLLAQLVNLTLKSNLTGLEWAVGIPGTVGGAICGNTGAFGSSMKDVVKKVEVFDIKKEKIKIFQNKNCEFNYRESVFKKNKNLIILSATLQLKKRDKEWIKNKIQENLNYRKETQPLNFPSAGSIFKNQKSKIKNQKLLKEFPEIKEFNKRRQIVVGWLIEKCGLKGKRIGNAKISEKHANFIVNLGNARAEDVKKLINLAKKSVKKKFKINLEEEICYLDFKK